MSLTLMSRKVPFCKTMYWCTTHQNIILCCHPHWRIVMPLGKNCTVIPLAQSNTAMSLTLTRRVIRFIKKKLIAHFVAWCHSSKTVQDEELKGISLLVYRVNNNKKGGRKNMIFFLSHEFVSLSHYLSVPFCCLGVNPIDQPFSTKMEYVNKTSLQKYKYQLFFFVFFF